MACSSCGKRYKVKVLKKAETTSQSSSTNQKSTTYVERGLVKRKPQAEHHESTSEK